MKKVVVGAIVLIIGMVVVLRNRPSDEPAKGPDKPVVDPIASIPTDLDALPTPEPAPKDTPKSPATKPAAPAADKPKPKPTPAQTKPAPPKPRVANAAAKSLLDTANEYLAKDKRWEARKLLSKALFISDGALAASIKAKLDELNETLIFSPEPTPGSTVHVVKRGEVLSMIERKYGTSYELIMRVNHKASDRIRIGERLKILTGEASIVVNKPALTLTLLLDGVYVKQYPCCIGKYDKTPAGAFVVSVKTKNPTWYAPDGHVYPFGHPKHQLGTRWIGLRETPELSGYGVHGTHDPGTVPGRKSMGCVRLKNADVEVVYDFVKRGTKVEIRE